MKKLLIAGFILTCNANAQVVSVECPKSYPPKASPLDVASPGHTGRGLVPANNPLEDWGIFDGEFAESTQIHTGEDTKVKGGTDTKVPPIRWLVCYYRGGITWWDETGANKAADKGMLKEGCTVQARHKEKSIRLVCS